MSQVWILLSMISKRVMGCEIFLSVRWKKTVLFTDIEKLLMKGRNLETKTVNSLSVAYNDNQLPEVGSTAISRNVVYRPNKTLSTMDNVQHNTDIV